MTAARRVGRSADLEEIEKMDRELSEVIEDFGRAVDVDALHLARKIGEHPPSRCNDSSFSVVWCRARLSA